MTTKKAILINDTSSESHIGSIMVIQNLVKLCEERNIKINSFYKRYTVLKNSNQLKEDIKNNDLIIVNGEGSLHNSPQWFNVLLNILPNNKPCFLINTLWEKMFINDTQLLKKFKIISFRESFSYNDFKTLCSKHKNVRVVPDLIFNLKDNIQKIGYGDSVLQGLRIEHSKKDNYFPLQINTSQPDVYAYINWLKSLDYYVTGRFHGACLAILANTPFLVFPSNSHKIESLLKDIKCSELIIRTHKEICKERIWTDVKNYKKLFQTYRKNAKIKIKQLFDDIAKEIEQ